MCTRISHCVLEQVLKENVKNGSRYLPKRQTPRSLLALPLEPTHSPHQLTGWLGACMASRALQFGGELALHVKVLKAILHLCRLEVGSPCHPGGDEPTGLSSSLSLHPPRESPICSGPERHLEERCPWEGLLHGQDFCTAAWCWPLSLQTLPAGSPPQM